MPERRLRKRGIFVTGGGDVNRAGLEVCGFGTGIVNQRPLTSDSTARIWSIDAGELVAGPFQCLDWVGVVRFSTDLKKLAVKSWMGKCLEVWDVQSQELDVRIVRIHAPARVRDKQQQACNVHITAIV
jgi:hypothetical protein